MIFKRVQPLAFVIAFTFSIALTVGLEAQTRDSGKTKPSLSESYIQMQALSSRKIQLKFDKKSFSESLALIREKSKLNFLIDDIPPEELFSMNIDSDLKTVLDKFTLFFDYYWKIGKSGEIQMLRRFSGETDLPQTNLLEMKQVSREMLSVFESLGSVPGTRESGDWKALKFVESLNPLQLKTIENEETISASQLNAEQFRLFKTATWNFLLNPPTQIWGKFHLILNNLTKMNIKLTSDVSYPALNLNIYPRIQKGFTFYIRSFDPTEIK